MNIGAALKQRQLPFLLIFAAVLAHLPAFWSEFVHWDDYHVVLGNPLIQSLSFHMFKGFDPELYVPLTFFTYQIEHALFDFHPLSYHATNLALHVVNSLLILKLISQVSPAPEQSSMRGFALFGALVFAVHPLHVEAVSWVSARRDLLMTTFALASLVKYLRGGTKQILLSIFFFLLALLSKPTATVLPCILLFLKWNDIRHAEPVEARRKATIMIKHLAPFFALSGLFVLINLSGQAHTNFPLNIPETFLLASRSIVFTLQKFFFPFGLTILYPATPSWSAPYIGSFILLLFLAALLWRFRRNRTIMLGVLFFLFTLAPGLLSYMKSDLVTLAPDHYSYLPSIGVLIVITALLSRFFVRHAEEPRESGASRSTACPEPAEGSTHGFFLARTWFASTSSAQATLTMTWIFIIVVFCVLSFKQSLVWQNSETLFAHAIEAQPTHIAWNNLGFTYLEQGRMSEAETAFEQALILNPRSVDAHLNLASIAYKNGDLVKTEEHVRAAAAINPTNPEVQFNLGGIYFLKEQWDEAIISYRIAIQLQPTFARAHLQLARSYLKKGMWEEAQVAYRKALEIQPSLQGSISELGQ